MEITRFFEFDLSPAALLLLIVYHVYLYRKMCNDPLSTSLGLARRTRALQTQTIIPTGAANCGVFLSTPSSGVYT
jgi:hypothetical protein